MLVGGLGVAQGDQAVHGAEAGGFRAVHRRDGQERILHGDGVLHGGAVVGLERGVVLVDVVLEERHGLAEDHGLALLAHDHALTGFNAVVGHIAGLRHILHGLEKLEHVVGGVGILEIVGERVVQTRANAEDIQEVGRGDAGVGKHEAEAVVGGAVLDDFEELLVGPALGLDLRNVGAGGLEHFLVGAESLNGDVQRETVNGVLNAHVVERVLVVVRQTLGVHVLRDVNGDAQLNVGADGGVGYLRDVRRFTGIRHGGQLAVVIVPGGLDYFHGEVRIDLGEISDPGFDVILIGAGDRGNHHGDGIGGGLLFRGLLGGLFRGLLGRRFGRLLRSGLLAAGGESEEHNEGKDQCKDLFHVDAPFSSLINVIQNPPVGMRIRCRPGSRRQIRCKTGSCRPDRRNTSPPR